MSLQAGQQIGFYEITSLLGKGGMGEVYRARDTKLKRDVAIKILPEEFSSDPDRVSRFQREAEVLASLNHSNIAAIYDLEEAKGSRFLVLELVEGETLAERIARGPLPVDEALDIARHICEAMEAAHEKGVVHRDLKPANVKITPDGKVKVLDFGLAKAMERNPAKATLSNSPTLINSMAATNAGVIIGTAAYMSPEQAKGLAADPRSDVFSFGCVLYEMLTGKQAFQGDTVSDVLASILAREPDMSLLPANLSPKIQKLLRRAIEKNPKRRWYAAGDMRVEIEEAAIPLPLGEVAAAPARRVRVAWLAAAFAMAIAGLLAIPAVMHFREASAPEIRLDVTTPPSADPVSFAISPDGRRLVFVASNEGKSQLWIRPLDSITAQPLAGTDGASSPFWSPDSASLGFFADGKLKRIDIVGGAPQVLANATGGRGGSWNLEGIILFAPTSGGPLFKTPATGGEPVAVTRLEAGQSGHKFPWFLPDGRHFIYFVQGGPGQGIYAGSLDGTSSRRLVTADAAAVVSPLGFLLFPRQSTLFAQPFDFKKQEFSGDPFSVAEQVAFDGGTNATGLSATSGIVAYRIGAGGGDRQLTWLDRSGKAVGIIGARDAAALNEVELSPDGKRVAVWRVVNGNQDIWLIDTARGVPTRFTFDPSVDLRPLWSLDGSRIVFSSFRTGVYNLYWKLSSGAGAEELLLESDQIKMPNDWSSDGRFLLFRSIDPRTGIDLWVLPMSGANASPAGRSSQGMSGANASPAGRSSQGMSGANASLAGRSSQGMSGANASPAGRSSQEVSGDKKPFPFLKTPFEEREGQFSPDGKWIAYQSNESGRFEIYVQPFPGPGGKFQISANGGGQPRWNKNGKEIFYVSLDSKMIAAPVKLSPDGQSLETGTPMALFPVRIAGGTLNGANRQQYAVSSDGQRFLVNLATEEGTTSPITLIYNWKPKATK